MFFLLKFRNFQRNVIKFSTKSKADVIKNLNYENKALYGPVIKENNNKKKSKIKSEDSNKITDEPLSNSTNKDSERYWLLESNLKKDNKLKNNKNDAVITSLNSTTKKSIKIEPLSESLSETKKQIKSSKKKIQNKLKFEINNQFESEFSSSKNLNEIPFNDNDLKNILKFPLVSNDNYLTKNLLSTVRDDGDDDDGNQLGSSTKFKYPSVGKILQATMSENSRKALINWKLTKISELGEEGFLNLQKDLLQQGKLFHKALQDYLVSFETPTIDPSISGVWDSVIVGLRKLQPKTELIEARIEHPYLKYCGIVDYVSHVRSNLSIIEWKKSNKLKDNINLTYDAPIQLCAYLGALNYDKNYYKINNNINCGYVIIAYNDGKPAEIHYLDQIQLQKYWNLWLKRLQEYWIRFRDGTLPEPI